MNYMFEYHPIRFNHNLEYLINDTINEYANSQEDDREKYKGLLLESIYEKELTFLFEEFDSIPHDMSKEGWAQYKEELFGAYISYMTAGENIFHIQDELLQMFKKTEVKDIELTDLNVPYHDFYIYFGNEKYFKLSNGSFLDGAYLNFSKDGNSTSLFIYLTHYNTSFNYGDSSRDELAFLKSDDHLYYLLSGDEGETVGELLKQALPEAENEILFLGEEWKLHLKEISNLIINCLCYLSSPHNDSDKRFPDNTPESFIKKYNNAKSKNKKQKAIEKIKSQGFRLINYLGDSVKVNRAQSSLNPEGLSVSSHWRRGHWRNQAYGKGRSEHKHLWIKPTMINPDKAKSTIKHIYKI